MSKKQNGGSPSKVVMYYVYILLNEAKTRTYTGVSDDVHKRLEEHNAEQSKILESVSSL